MKLTKKYKTEKPKNPGPENRVLRFWVIRRFFGLWQKLRRQMNWKTEKPKNLNDNDNVNYNVNNLCFPEENKKETYQDIRTKTEKPKNPRDEEKPSGTRFFSNDDVETEKPKNEPEQFFGFQTKFQNDEISNNITDKKVQVILDSPLISRDEANYLLQHSDLPLFITEGKMYMEDNDKEWIIT